MTTFNFDMHRIGQAIARLRREHNMTQMQLADRMCVSFQAVSNWERGQSMPDVSKLPELAEILGTSIDELLGRSAPLVTHAAYDTLDEYMQSAAVSVDEIAESAPLLMPDQVEQVTSRLLGLQEFQSAENQLDSQTPPEIPADVQLLDLTALLPFLSTAKVDMIARRYAAENRSTLSACLPFASSTLLRELAEAWEQEGRDIAPVVPFLSCSEVDRIAHSRLESGKPFVSLLPFMSTATVERIFLTQLQNGESINSLLPFVSSDFLSRLADAALKPE